MKSIQVIALALVFITAFSCKEAKKETEEATEEIEETVDQVVETINPEVITFSMEPKSDSNLSGEVIFTQENGQVTMEATILGLSEGQHAIHIHQKADCSAADGTSAGC